MSTSIRGARPPARAATCIWPSGPAPTAYCGAVCSCGWPNAGAIDAPFIEAHTRGFAWALRRASALAPRLDAVASATGVDRQAIATFFDWFAATPRVVSCYSQGVNQSAQGTDKVNAIINCHLATGRIGKPGSGPLSLTGQPNAMGGREVGGLANMLAAHMGFSEGERDRVRRFWDAPNVVSGEGLKAVAHVRRGGRRAHQGAVGNGHQPGGVASACRCDA